MKDLHWGSGTDWSREIQPHSLVRQWEEEEWKLWRRRLWDGQVYLHQHHILWCGQRSHWYNWYTVWHSSEVEKVQLGPISQQKCSSGSRKHRPIRVWISSLETNFEFASCLDCHFSLSHQGNNRITQHKLRLATTMALPILFAFKWKPLKLVLTDQLNDIAT